MMSSAARIPVHALCLLLVAGALALGSAAAATPPAVAAPPGATFVDLGAAASYSVLGGTSVANTGSGTVLAGVLGLSPSGTITGFPPGTLSGAIHDKDVAAELAQSDRCLLYTSPSPRDS